MRRKRRGKGQVAYATIEEVIHGAPVITYRKYRPSDSALLLALGAGLSNADLEFWERQMTGVNRKEYTRGIRTLHDECGYTWITAVRRTADHLRTDIQWLRDNPENRD